MQVDVIGLGGYTTPLLLPLVPLLLLVVPLLLPLVPLLLPEPEVVPELEPELELVPLPHWFGPPPPHHCPVGHVAHMISPPQPSP
jgi:hypothetical protein